MSERVGYMKKDGKTGKNNPFKMSPEKAKAMLTIYKLAKLSIKINKGEDREPTLEELVEFHNRCEEEKAK